ERLHQEAVARLAVGRAGDQLPARALRLAQVGPAERDAAARDPLQRLQLELLPLAPALLGPVAGLAGQEAGPQPLQRALGAVARVGPALLAGSGARRPDGLLGLLDVDGDGLGQHEPHALAALDRRRGD